MAEQVFLMCRRIFQIYTHLGLFVVVEESTSQQGAHMRGLRGRGFFFLFSVGSKDGPGVVISDNGAHLRGP